MGDIVVFRRKDAAAVREDDGGDIDLMTAVDVAIRDLRDLAAYLTIDAARDQAIACRTMLERAFDAASQRD